jgi:hypothetical protein
MNTRDEKDNAAGHKQSDFAGTNPDRYGDPKPVAAKDMPIADEEAQNVTDGPKRMQGEEAQHGVNKANHRTEQQGGSE